RQEMAMTTRDDLRRLVDQLADDELHAARRYLEYLKDCGDPVLRAFLNAPEVDEPETEEERLAVEEAKAALARGDVVSHDELRRELGL
ncbi:MAG: hypothetical protein WD645_06070, partial [Dehalococcoidia bacterium]